MHMSGLLIILVKRWPHLRNCKWGVFLFYALNSVGQLIHISSVKNNQAYYCPTCKEKLILRVGNLKAKHFAHQRLNCRGAIHESIIHRTGKLILKKWGEEFGFQTKTEVYLPKIKRRADIIFYSSKSQIVVEYQCSPISVTKLTERSYAYSQLGIKFLWIIGKRYRLNGKISQQIAQFLNYHPHLGFYMIYLNVTKQRFELYYQIQKADFLAPRYNTQYFYNLKELFYFIQHSNKDRLFKLTLKSQSQQLHNFQRAEMYSNGITHFLQVQCYLKKYNFHNQVLNLLSAHCEYPIFKYSRVYYLLGKMLKLPENQFIYQMPLINYQNFI